LAKACSACLYLPTAFELSAEHHSPPPRLNCGCVPLHFVSRRDWTAMKFMARGSMSAAPQLPYSLRRPATTEQIEDQSSFRALLEPPPDRASIDLPYYWKVLRKRLWLVTAVVIVATASVGIYELTLPDLYTASSTILIRGSTPRIMGDNQPEIVSASAPSPEMGGDADMFLNTKYQLLQTESLALKVIRAEKLWEDPAFTGAKYRHSLVGELKRRVMGGVWVAAGGEEKGGGAARAEGLVGAYLGALRVQPVTGTQLVQITFTTRDAGLSARLANAHVRQFIAQGIELNAQASEEAERFLGGKLGELKRKVEESEAALNDYRRDKGIVPGLISVNGKDDIVLERLNKLSEQLQEAHLRTISLGARMALIKQGHADALPAVVDNGVVQKLKDHLAELEQEYAGMGREFKPNYPPMAALRARIADTRAAIGAEE